MSPIRLGVEVTGANALRDFGPDLVVIATGSRPRAPCPSLNVNVPVLQVGTYLLDAGAIEPGAKGGRRSAAEWLASRPPRFLASGGCAVTVIELLPTVARDMARNNRFDVLVRLDEYDVRILTEARIDTVVEGDLMLLHKGERLRRAPGDAIVVAIGPEP